MAHPDITSQRFGRLVALNYMYSTPNGAMWRCKCDCGGEHIANACHLRRGSTRSCGCLRLETHAKHCMTKTPTYRVWSAMLGRCYTPTDKRYEIYGARGIKVCDEWHEFESFYRDMGEAPEGLSLDRKDNDQGYCKSNCRWATDTEQAENRRTTRRFTHAGQTQSLKAWCRELNQPYLRAYKRIVYRGWSFNKALGVSDE